MHFPISWEINYVHMYTQQTYPFCKTNTYVTVNVQKLKVVHYKTQLEKN